MLSENMRAMRDGVLRGDHRALRRKLSDEERTVIEGAIQNPALSLERRAALRLRLLLERERVGGLNG